METGNLFESMRAQAPAPALNAGLLVTNHLNLMYMLAAGLVTPPAAFGGKYYRDPLESFPGWIPLFIDRAPAAAIEMSTSEANHLRPVIVSIGLSQLAGRVMAFRDGRFEPLYFPNACSGAERVLLVPAPLPVSWIESILFRSGDDRRACEADAKDFGNVPLEDFDCDARKRRLFTGASAVSWPPGDGPGERSVPLHAAQAAGGVMAALLRFGNLGEPAIRACRTAFDPGDDVRHATGDHPILAGLGSWILDGATSLPDAMDAETDSVRLRDDFQASLFWGAVERMLDCQAQDRGACMEAVLVDHLAAVAARIDRRLRAGVRRLHDTLASLADLPDATAEELFERHDTPLARAMTLFFLRRDSAALLDFSSDRLREPDWLAAAILFGVRDGWLKLPLGLRAGRKLSDAVSHRMARLSHRLAGTGLDLGEVPARVRPLRELFGGDSAWRSRQRNAALALARKQKWRCLHTRVALGPGEYTLTVKGGSTYIDMPGEPRISPHVDVDRFFDALAGTRLSHAIEEDIRRQLGD